MALICIDPGHGGSDPGAVSRPWWRSWLPGVEPVQEKDAVLAVATILAHNLTGAGHEVRMTRWADIYVSINDRIAMFRSREWDAIVSLHCNASGTSGSSLDALGHGHEVWWGEGDETSQRFANAVNDALADDWRHEGLTNRGIKLGSPATRTNWYTFQDYDQMADILVELCFVTHPDDAKLLTEDRYGDWATTLGSGIADFLRGGRQEPESGPAGPVEVSEPMNIDLYDLRVGTWNWLDEPGQPPGTPVGVLAYAFDATPGLDLMARADHAAFLANNGLRVFYRIDYRPGQTAPRDENELADFLAAVDGLFASHGGFQQHVQDTRIVVSAFNEPNNPGEGGFSARWIARCFCGYGSDAPEDSFTGKVRAERNGGPHCHIAVPAPNCNGSATADGELLWGERDLPDDVEDSPWASWYYDLLASCELALADRGWPSGYDILALHSYGRISAVTEGLDPALEPFDDIRSGQGWRFGSNGMITWREVIQAAGLLDGIGIWYTEFTIINEDRATDTYPAGWMFRWRDAALQVHGSQVEAALWFVGDGHGVWENTSLGSPAGRGPIMREDYMALKRLEDMSR